MPPVGPKHRIPSLDGLRAFSILLVIAYHGLNAWNQRVTGSMKDYHGLWLILLNGNLGVSIFFVISGFLITRLLLREIEKTGTIRLTDFYLRRTFRIWPAFYFYLLVIVLLHVPRLRMLDGARAIDIAARDVIAAATFTFNYLPGGGWWVGHSWSLSVEEQFYFFWPAVLLIAGRKKAVWVAVALLILAPILRAWEITHLPPGSIWVVKMWQTAHTRVDTLMYGCLLGLLWTSPRLQAVIKICRDHWIGLLAALVPTTGSYALLTTAPSVVYGGLQYTFEGIAIALIIALLVTSEHSLIGRVFNSKPLVHIGRISFSLYLWQQVFMTSLNTSWSGRFPFNVICSFAVAELSYFLIEQPALALRGRLFSRTRHPAAVAPAVPQSI